MSHSTPLLVDTSTSFKEYLGSLTKSARKQWTYVEKHNQDLKFGLVEYHREEIDRFMKLWSQQVIHGSERPIWAFGVDYVEELVNKGVIRIFEARNNEVVAMQFVEVYGDYMDCHPPMWDKTKHKGRYLAKYMWFNLIKWCCDNEVNYLDLGGGHRGTWQDLIKDRKKHTRIAYKWVYVPKRVKDNPELEKPYIVKNKTLCID